MKRKEVILFANWGVELGKVEDCLGQAEYQPGHSPDERFSP